MITRDEVIKLKEQGLTDSEIVAKVGVTKQRVSQILHPAKSIIVPLNEKPVLRLSEAALLLGVHPNTARRWSNRGLLKSFRLPVRGDRRFLRSEVEKFYGGEAIQ